MMPYGHMILRLIHTLEKLETGHCVDQETGTQVSAKNVF